MTESSDLQAALTSQLPDVSHVPLDELLEAELGGVLARVHERGGHDEDEGGIQDQRG